MHPHHKLTKNMKKNILYTVLAFICFIPNVVFGALVGVKALLDDFQKLLPTTIKVVIGLGVLYFFWGMGQFILHAGDQKTREDGKNKMIWGVIALFVMFSIWGIVDWIGVVLGIPVGGNIIIPVPAPTP